VQLGAAALSSRRGAATGRITQKSYQRIFDEIFWRGVVVESFRGLWMFQKKLLFITKVLTAHSPLRLSRPLSIGEGRLLGRLSRPKAER